MLRFQSVVELTHERRQLLTIGARGGLEPTKDRTAAALTLRHATDGKATGVVQFGAIVIFEGAYVGSDGRTTNRKSLPYMVMGASGKAKGDVPDSGSIALFPTRSEDSTSRTVDALVVDLRVTVKPRETPTGTTGTGSTGSTTTTSTSGGGGGGSSGDDDMPMLGEIKMFCGNYAPRGWAFCDGQSLSISANTALFSILGTTYGGDGSTVFKLPDLRGRFAMHAGVGQGFGVGVHNLGGTGGTETVTLTPAELPSHNHTVTGVGVSTQVPDPIDPREMPPEQPLTGQILISSPGASAPSVAVTNAGGALPHTNMPPFGTVNFIIATVGTFPSRA